MPLGLTISSSRRTDAAICLRSRCMITVSHRTLSNVPTPRSSGNSPCANLKEGYRRRASLSRPSEASKPTAEKPLDDFLQVDGRRLIVPVLRERRRIQFVSGERLTIHDLAFDLRKIRNRAGRRADL